MPWHGGSGKPRLRNAALSLAYRRHLKEAGGWLLGIVTFLGGSLTASSPPRKVDRWLEQAIDYAYREGAKLYWVRLGLLGIQRAFDLSGPLLRGSWSAVRAWVQLQPSKPRTPMTLFVLECVLLALLGRGNSLKGKDRLEWWSAMLATWISFEGLLRPGEADFLVAGDLLFPEDTEMAQGVSLIVGIRRAKTRRTWALQHALINNAQLVRWLRWWAADFPRKRKLFPVARRKWANYFREVVLQLGLQSCEFTLGSLRAGGATHQFRVHRNLGALQYAGRLRLDRFVCCSKKLSMDRLSGALRELAAALEEVAEEEKEWEVVAPGQPSQATENASRTGPRARAAALRVPPSSRPTSSSSTSAAASSTLGTAGRTDTLPSSTRPQLQPEPGRPEPQPEHKAATWGATPRHYLVTFSPKDRALEGHWFGPWAKLEPQLPGGKFFGSAVQLQKLKSKAMAEREWAAVHGRRPMPSRDLQ